MAGTRFAFPTRRRAGCRASPAARCTTLVSLPWATTAAATTATQTRCRQVTSSESVSSARVALQINLLTAFSLRRPAAPCPPSQLNVSVNCEDDTATLAWSSSPNAVSYTGKAVSADGTMVTCDAGSSLTCQMNGLQCGKEYNFTVSASDGDCQSSDSEPVFRATGE